MTATKTARKPRRQISDARRQELETRRNEIELAAEKVDQEAPDFSAFLARWGNRYNLNNLCRLWVQAPGATCLHKYGTWQSMGRQVRRGETAIMLMHPRTSSDPDRVTPENPDGRVFHGASWMALFDFAQTEPIDEFTEKAGADADPALAAEVKRLRLAATEVHPDRGGTPEAFTEAWARYEAAKARLDGGRPVVNDAGMTQWQLAELAVKVGGLLGMALDPTWEGPGVRIGTEGNGVHLDEPSGRRGYVQARGWFPWSSYSSRDGRRPVTVRADRGAGVIAAEIGRRLLPAYRAEVARVREHDAAERAAQEARDRLAAYITGLFPAGKTSMPGHCQTRTRSQVTVRLPGALGGWVHLSCSGDEVEFERFRVPAAVALRMLETAALLTDMAGD